MIWWIVLIVLFGALLWLLVSPVVLEIDTRTPAATVNWRTIGDVQVWFEDEWWLSFRLFFFRKTIRFADMKSKEKKKRPGRIKRKKKIDFRRMLRKIGQVITSFQVMEWRLALDTGDNCRNAQLFPLNYLPRSTDHLLINFMDENYLVLKIRNRPWKMLYAFLR